MAPLPQVRSATALAIDSWYERQPAEPHGVFLRPSGLGNECDRALWYAFRWASQPEAFPPRILRIFQNGHDREARIVEMLKGAGIDVQDRDPETGKQWRAVLIPGLCEGSCDGVAMNVPEAPKTAHLVEIKTMSKARWEAWRRKGVRESDPKYYVQIQLYMHGLGLTRCLFVAENQDSKEIEAERIAYDPAFALAQVERARRIAFAENPPPRVSDDPDNWLCRKCPSRAVCHDGEAPPRNCRTCLAASVAEGGWRCERHGVALDAAAQAAGCPVHLYLPGLVAGDVVTADERAATVTYRMPDGSMWTDGEPAHD